MAEMLGRLSSMLLGDPSLEGLQQPVTTFEELHAEVQRILVPPPVSPGIQVNLLQPVNKNFAMSYRMFLESSKKDPNPLAAMFGGGKPKSDESHRILGIGGVLTHRFETGGFLRAFAQLDSIGASKFTALIDPTGTNKLRLAAQMASIRNGPRQTFDWAASAVLRGVDYGASLRIVNGPEVGLSYLQRLVPGSPITLGGEFWFNFLAFRQIKRVVGATYPKPVEWTVGGAYDARESKTGVHFTWSGGADGILLHLHHLYRLNDRCNLAAKSIINMGGLNSMVAAGYSLTFRNTHTQVVSMVDSYGGVRTSVEREVLKDMKLLTYLRYNPGASAPNPREPENNSIGFKLSLGSQPKIEPPMSPCTLNRMAFRIQ